ncbi:hypothetical protein [Heliorestis convoluta]|uniref:Chemotaxis methyl-accepting receptor n=1 Tax=Heliorestis convoluta TaxID=356322 RepID=A0A5Q2N282_9FIRM|nr:hypothetical protein [Heliorestis convoluta]QGG46450.1 Putative chemotaxis methyl-accepting receptor [Heliorestis convoluta]
MDIPVGLHIFFIICALSGAFAVGLLFAQRYTSPVSHSESSQTVKELTNSTMTDELFEKSPIRKEPLPSNSDYLSKRATRLQQDIDAMIELSRAMKANISDVNRETEQAALTLADVMEQIGDMGKKNPEIQSEMNKIVQKGVSALQFQDITRQKLENMQGLLNDFTELLQHDKSLPRKTSQIAEVAQEKYTTHGELMNHQKYVSKNKGQELGNNVELF